MLEWANNPLKETVIVIVIVIGIITSIILRIVYEKKKNPASISYKVVKKSALVCITF